MGSSIKIIHSQILVACIFGLFTSICSPQAFAKDTGHLFLDDKVRAVQSHLDPGNVFYTPQKILT